MNLSANFFFLLILLLKLEGGKYFKNAWKEAQGPGRDAWPLANPVKEEV